jgi:hypothetical protein
VKEAGELHSAGKNAVGSVLNALDSPNYKYSEVRALLRTTLVQMEEVIRRARNGIRVSSDTPQPLGALWEAALAVLPQVWRSRCVLQAEAHSLLLGLTDRQLVQRLLSDLVTNALKAGASHVHCSVRNLHDGRRPRIEVSVQDDGVGMPSGVLDDPMTSLSVMAHELSRFGGDLTFTRPNCGSPGTVVRACWRSADLMKMQGPQSKDAALESAEWTGKG